MPAEDGTLDAASGTNAKLGSVTVETFHDC